MGGPAASAPYADRQHDPSCQRVADEDSRPLSVEADGRGASMAEDPAFKLRIDVVEVQILAMEFTEFRILGALAVGWSSFVSRVLRRNLRTHSAPEQDSTDIDPS